VTIGVTRGFGQGVGNVVKGSPLANTQKKMRNESEYEWSFYTKTRNNCKIL